MSDVTFAVFSSIDDLYAQMDDKGKVIRQQKCLIRIMIS